MYQTTTIKDGALGYGAADGRGMAVVGVATGGTANTPVLASQPQQAYDAFLTGKLPDRIGLHFGAGGPGPVLGVRAAASTAGSLPTYRASVHAAVAATAANAFPGPITQPASPRNVEVDFGAGWDGGNVVITGTDVIDAAQTDTITGTAGATVKGAKVFKTISSIAKLVVGAAAATATVYTGNKSAAVSGTDAQMSVAGTPTEDLDVIVQVSRNGDVAAGTPAARVSYDGGDTYGAEVAIPVGGTLPISFGLTLTFVGASLKNGDSFRFLAIGPAMTSGDVVAALGGLSTTPYTYEFVHIAGKITGAIAASIISWLATERAAGRWRWALVEARDYNEGETDAAYQASVLADWGAVVEPYGALVAVPTSWEHVLPGNRGIQRRSWAWSVGTKIASVDLSVHPGSPAEAGPLRGLYTQITGTPPRTHDERVNPGLGGTIGRFCTVQSLLGREYEGLWYIGDAQGLRSPGTMAHGTSDFSLLMNMRVILEAARRLQSKNSSLLGRRLRTKTTGELLPSFADTLDGELSQFVTNELTNKGHCQRARVVVSRTARPLVDRKLPYACFILPWAYALHVATEIGFEATIVGS